MPKLLIKVVTDNPISDIGGFDIGIIKLVLIVTDAPIKRTTSGSREPMAIKDIELGKKPTKVKLVKSSAKPKDAAPGNTFCENKDPTKIVDDIPVKVISSSAIKNPVEVVVEAPKIILPLLCERASNAPVVAEISVAVIVSETKSVSNPAVVDNSIPLKPGGSSTVTSPATILIWVGDNSPMIVSANETPDAREPIPSIIPSN